VLFVENVRVSAGDRDTCNLLIAACSWSPAVLQVADHGCVAAWVVFSTVSFM
jgi:hypothetical protein